MTHTEHYDHAKTGLRQASAAYDASEQTRTRYALTALGYAALAITDTLTAAAAPATPAALTDGADTASAKPSDDAPPADHPYAAALWLVRRHPQLAELARRVPGVHGHDSQGPWLDLDALADGINHYDDDQAPEDDTIASAAACEFSRLSGSEQGRLRLLATMGWSSVRFRVGMLSAFDQAGQALIGDWYTALRAS
jgi:hypothetical protein